jgi:2-dehydropantoate 2-reductase
MIVTQLCDELALVARAERIDLSATQLRDEVYRVMRATANNKSSMLQDIESGYATEIDFINGFVVQRAHQHGIACTQHEGLLAAVHTLEQAALALTTRALT